LFTAIFNIVGNATTPIPVGFQTGCTTSSSPPSCVTIENGSTAAVAETVQAATYSTPATGVPYFTLSSNKPSIQFLQGIAGTSQAIITESDNPPGNKFNCGGLTCVDISVTGPAAGPSVVIS